MKKGERKMTAKEMFEELGYEQTMNIDGLIEYIDYIDYNHNEIGYIYIRFDLFWKSYEVGYFDGKTKTEKAIVATTAEHKAITKQMKELGWI